MIPKNPIFCAVDTTDLKKAQSIVSEISQYVGGIKLGLEFFTKHGVSGVREVVPQGVPLFLDLKFHDIPNTVKGAVSALAELEIFMLTIHASGGLNMMESAKEASLKLPGKPKVIGVTVLTSLSEQDFSGLGFSIDSYSNQLALNVKNSGIDGLVCSGHELEHLKKSHDKLIYVVPGIRPSSSSGDDQKRVVTASEAIKKGANYLVIGRPITEAKNPSEAVRSILQSF